ncbi:MAG: Asp-tRNA(Asn)/Glu-tRNA(Gln) amidotransferase subunit GatB [Minisyncoccia bacterium]
MTYRPTIGLEVHAELKTHTKMFCDSPNDPDETRINQNVCPVCLAHPGTLPVINKEAVRHVLRIGTAVSGTLADYSEFDRKSYFYPDIPKGYQISQYEHPLVLGGSIQTIPLTRIHLEEDTARSTHRGGTSLVDFNRAGVPLMELVTEPAIHDAETASSFARELQLLLRTLGASDANLEKGEMRIEVNISISNEEGKFGTKVEIKNINSFRSVERAIAYEIERQTALLEKGEKVLQETRGWDENKQVTFRQRTKEGSADYRYFPEPDLPKLMVSSVSEFSPEALRASLPELPWDRRTRYQKLGLSEDAIAYLSEPTQSAFFDAALSEIGSEVDLIPLSANYILSDVAGWYAKQNESFESKITPATFVALMRMVSRDAISSRGAKDILIRLLEKGGDPEEIAKHEGLEQVSDVETLRAVVQEVITANISVADEYRSGKDAALQFLVGQSMKASRGAGNPQTLRALLVEELSK